LGARLLTKTRRTGNIEHFLSQETGVDPDAVLAFLSDGRRLQTENVRELAGSQDQVGVMPGLRRAAR
jgi:autophagy-related protein 11